MLLQFHQATGKVLTVRVLLEIKVLQHAFVYVYVNTFFQKQLNLSIIFISLNIYNSEYASFPINFSGLQHLQENDNCSTIRSSFTYITHFNFKVHFIAIIYLSCIYFFPHDLKVFPCMNNCQIHIHIQKYVHRSLRRVPQINKSTLVICRQ